MILEEWRDYRIVQQVLFRFDTINSACELILELSQDPEAAEGLVELRFGHVRDLELSGLGGGLTQLLCLRARDVRSAQWDRVSYEVEDLERRAIFFRCKELHASRLP
jgi:hypothetical protein